ncbi:anthranilate synthase component I family protein [Mycetocola zhujimingii]|uniref:Aminodeoxychorismate synthase component I n=1 Tax=Mycetocola zhujimingii TaxID=2079792 RepID=A0A2U1TGY7_9MICO|nr:anthranilate synthase component I family protein [Mycetocola zhujimingii]PWC08161.1 aminodeoxychorismate synthase component I [Mycetocola zhujimingii]
MQSGTTTRALDIWVDPEEAFLALFSKSEHAFWLDSGRSASTGFSYLGDGSTTLTASVADGTVTYIDGDGETPRVRSATVFDALADVLAQDAARDRHDVTVGEFSPGWVGWLGYEAGAAHVGTRHHRSRYPDAALVRAERVLVFDHAARTVTAVVAAAQVDAGEPGSEPDFSWLDPLKQRGVTGERAEPAEPADPDPAGPVRWRHDPGEYRALIARAQDHIRAGDAYLLCLTNELRIDGSFDATTVYRRLRRSSPSHHGGLIRIGGVALVSSSPEQFLRITPDRTITTRPIKGTRPRGDGHVTDAAQRDDLLASVKERAENLMIVDLMRNDLGRIAALGSVRVSDLLTVESYAQVHQLVSTVTARLAEGVTPVAAVAAAFPAGSMTGAPKLSAMGLLDDLEQGPRGVYSGAFGYFGADGAVDLAMVIRSILINGDGATIGTGGGITALSVADDEVEEIRLKAAALLDALGASQQEVG